MKRAVFIIIIILLIDQVSKIYIKTHFVLSEEIKVLGLDWFRIHFLENNGMAWGKEFGGRSGKLFLTLFRLVAIAGIGYWMYDAIKNNSHRILVTAIALIFAGAMGNIIDSVFYGIFFSDSYRELATFLPPEGGYESLFHGKVVDMLYFPIIQNATWPEWVPYFGGGDFSFFEPVFNIADTAISTGVGILLVFNKKAFPKIEEEVAEKLEDTSVDQILEKE